MPALEIMPYAAPVTVTLAYLVVYYGSILNVLRVKKSKPAEYAARGEKFDRYFHEDREMLAADRAQLNTLEHMGPFLALLWMNAVFVGPTEAGIAGGVYVLARVAHPFVMGARLGRGTRATIMLATVPGYLVLIYFLVRLCAKLITG